MVSIKVKYYPIISELESLIYDGDYSVDERIEYLRELQTVLEDIISELQTEDGNDE